MNSTIAKLADEFEKMEKTIASQKKMIETLMLLALNPLFDSYLPKLENFSKAVPVTVLATGV